MDDKTFDGISRSLASTTSRRQAFKLIGGGLAGSFVAAKGIDLAAAKPASGSLTTPVEGFLPNGDAFAGTLQVTQFANQGGQLAAIGNILNGLNQVISGFTALVTGATGSCEILDLTLGPINLDLLGLVITTNEIKLNITAESGPGNLLGNLLCAVANLLNGGGPLGAIAGLLNNILRALGRA